ncbi:MAG TPA: MnhB domain-containing protein [Solirubrobacteraceae bacterium]|jgi:multicomponent Na+:H+ antiporter subunit B|nr:MnhB domain-containing protein [Solirubrobacteraceae bacterium]
MYVFGAGALGLAALLVLALTGLPAFGEFNGAYAILINHVVVPQRHATDAVTAVNFDYRALDTMGEEFILFTSVVGLAVLLREQRGEHEHPSDRTAREHRFQGASYALRALTLVFVGPVVVLALYLDSHGALTPGGGFQGGVVGAAALLMVFLGGSYLTMRRLSPHALVELAESSGAAGYALVGLGGVVFAGVFFKNFLPYGTPGELLSAGTIPLSSMAVGLEVTGAFILLWSEFLDQALVVRGS